MAETSDKWREYKIVFTIEQRDKNGKNQTRQYTYTPQNVRSDSKKAIWGVILKKLERHRVKAPVINNDRPVFLKVGYMDKYKQKFDHVSITVRNMNIDEVKLFVKQKCESYNRWKIAVSKNVLKKYHQKKTNDTY